jgi:hypothetical protein
MGVVGTGQNEDASFFGGVSRKKGRRGELEWVAEGLHKMVGRDAEKEQNLLARREHFLCALFVVFF